MLREVTFSASRLLPIPHLLIAPNCDAQTVKHVSRHYRAASMCVCIWLSPCLCCPFIHRAPAARAASPGGRGRLVTQPAVPAAQLARPPSKRRPRWSLPHACCPRCPSAVRPALVAATPPHRPRRHAGRGRALPRTGPDRSWERRHTLCCSLHRIPVPAPSGEHLPCRPPAAHPPTAAHRCFRNRHHRRGRRRNSSAAPPRHYRPRRKLPATPALLTAPRPPRNLSAALPRRLVTSACRNPRHQRHP